MTNCANQAGYCETPAPGNRECDMCMGTSVAGIVDQKLRQLDPMAYDTVMDALAVLIGNARDTGNPLAYLEAFGAYYGMGEE